MKKKWFEKNKREYAAIAIAILMAFTGAGMAAHVFFQARQFLREEQNLSLLSVVEAADHSMEMIFDRYNESLSYVTQRRGFLTAEETWRTSGEVEDLLYRLRENILAQSAEVTAIAACQDGKVFASTNGRTDYYPVEPMDPEQSTGIEIYIDSEGAYYLAIVTEKEDISYAAFIPIERFYWMVEQNAVVYTQGEMLLIDDGGRICVEKENGKIVAYYLRNQAETRPEIEWMIRNQQGEQAGCVLFQMEDENTGDNYTARLGTLSVYQSVNGIFHVGVLSNYDEAVVPISNAAVKLFFFSAIMVAGVLMLIAVLFQAKKKEVEHIQELELLREKKAALEELNEQTQKFAHHQRLEVIGQLTSGISHDFNNLLTPIMGYSLMLMEKLPPEDTESYDNLLEIYNASRKAKEIISRLSSLSRKNTERTYQYFSPDDLVKQTMAVAAPARPEPVRTEMNCSCGETKLYGNETQFSQMLLNLVLNSYQAMEKTGGTLWISVSADDRSVWFSVKDNGPGIPEQIRDKIFDPFFTTKENGKGTGLGLAIVNQVVEEYKGTIAVSSKPWQGTEFLLSFPIQSELIQTIKR